MEEYGGMPTGRACTSFCSRTERIAACVTLAALVCGALASPACAQTVEEFFRNKQISLIVGFPPGGSYDLYARIAATRLPRYIPGNPTIVMRHVPGIGGVKASNYLYSQAPRDGLTMGIVSQGVALTQALREPTVEYDARAFSWIGRFAAAVQVTEVWHTVPVKTIADAMQRETVLAATSSGNTTDTMPRAMNHVLGTKFKIVRGYNGITGGVLAMERGEVEGSHDTVDNLLFSRPDWLKDKKVSVLVQYALARHPLLPDVPTSMELGKTAEDRQLLALWGSTAEVGRSLALPPGVPADRVAALRKAFAAVVADPELKAELAKRSMEFGPLTGEEMQRLIETTLGISPQVAARAIAAIRD
jgi:tripartite-type tricarboxylate transporter receptor subunit TctC